MDRENGFMLGMFIAFGMFSMISAITIGLILGGFHVTAIIFLFGSLGFLVWDAFRCLDNKGVLNWALNKVGL